MSLVSMGMPAPERPEAVLTVVARALPTLLLARDI